MSALWQVFLQKQLEIWEGKDKVLATWIGHAAPTDTIMLDVHLPATHAQGVIPASMPAMPITDADMIDASAPVLTPDTALVAASNPEVVLPMHAGTPGHAIRPPRPMLV